MTLFDRNKNLPVGTVVYFLPNCRSNDPIVSGVIYSAVEYESFLQYYLIEVEIPAIGDTHLELRTNMNVFLNKDDVPTLENMRKRFKGVQQ